jgi:hypothetical protein
VVVLIKSNAFARLVWPAIRLLKNWYKSCKKLEEGYEIQPGQIPITGALPKPLPGKPGDYVADFKGLGTISFEIR